MNRKEIMEVGDVRKNAGNVKAVTMILSRNGDEKLLGEGRVIVGVLRCQIYKRTNVMQMQKVHELRALGIGHF